MNWQELKGKTIEDVCHRINNRKGSKYYGRPSLDIKFTDGTNITIVGSESIIKHNF